jgi:hypothetical protein
MAGGPVIVVFRSLFLDNITITHNTTSNPVLLEFKD